MSMAYLKGLCKRKFGQNDIFVIYTKKRKTELETKITEFKQETTKTFEKEISNRGCVGSIAEIYDSTKPYAPKGAFSQAWSVAEILRIII